MTKQELNDLSDLARIHLTDEELEKFAGDFTQILDYVAALDSVEVPAGEVNWALQHNSVRDDEISENPGAYTKDFLANAPQSAQNRVKVQTILKNRS